MYNRELNNGYMVSREEIKIDVTYGYYETYIELVNFENEIILTNKDKTKEEFFNYLSFLISNEDYESIKDDLYDFYDGKCNNDWQEHEYIWSGDY